MVDIDTSIPPNERPTQYPQEPVQQDSGNPDFSRAFIALALIGFGALLLLANLNIVSFDTFNFFENWWALFLLIPIVSMGSGILYDVTKHGRLTGYGRGRLFGLMTMMLIFSIFFFGWHWGKIWPLFMILGGISMMWKKGYRGWGRHW